MNNTTRNLSSIITQNGNNLNNSMVIGQKSSQKDQTHNSLNVGANIKLIPLNKSKSNLRLKFYSK